ncbi:MAG: hypothetical protein BSR46_14580 [Candidatus Dactylopiibacterium carminicum]|nr:efflux RND transporter periplasmic adaptor subunit [Candidatus Dactylopiibacterium carminicum]PAS97020.1 MAG: hypothetical protein BSR46_14580 [Candidatus Dactylopiibacterium carminicum]
MHTPISHPRIRITLATLACVALAACGDKQDTTVTATETPQVGVFIVTASETPITTELAGRASARAIAEIRPQVGGILEKRLFTEGALVKAGQVLYQIDASSYEAAYASAKAAVTKAEATLKSSEVTARRNEGLARIDAISQQTAEDSQAAVEENRAALDVAKAALETARIDLEHTRITSPINGRVDISVAIPGALLTANQSTALTTVRQLDPLVVDVKQSSVELLRLRQELKAGKLRARGQEVPVKLILEDGSEYAHEGRLQFDGVSVDESTGMVTLRALVPNPEGVLLPGMYVRAQVWEGSIQDALLVPQEGITRRPSGDAIAMVVGDDGRIAERRLSLGRTVGNQWLVNAGLKPGDKVVVEGLKKVALGDLATAVPVSSDAAASSAAAH